MMILRVLMYACCIFSLQWLAVNPNIVSATQEIMDVFAEAHRLSEVST